MGKQKKKLQGRSKSRTATLQRYHTFRKVEQPILKEKNPEMHHHDLVKELSRQWAEKTPDEKKVSHINYSFLTHLNEYGWLY